MKLLFNEKEQAQQLRQRAEEKMRQIEATRRPDLRTQPPELIEKNIHELQVHQIELEMQNEELRKTQQELEASQARYFDLYDLAPVGYCTINESGMILESNLTATNLLGVNRNELAHQPISRFITRNDQDTYYQLCRKLFKTGKPQHTELQMKKNDGSEFWAAIDATFQPAEKKQRVCRIIISDITSRKQAEDEKEHLEEQLQQAQKLESIGRLAGGVAHDFNNMLGTILGHTEIALGHLSPSEPLYEDLKEIQTAANRSATLTQQLLTFARHQPIVPQPLNLDSLVSGMLIMLRRLIGENIAINWAAPPDLWKIKMDPTQIDQMIMNLCLNARDAIDGCGTISIEARNISRDASREAQLSGCYGKETVDIIPGEYVQLSVCDNGCGMPKETKHCLFEPFYTTKEVGQGTGLGLSTVYGIVKQNNCFLKIDTEPDRGSTFSIFLPRHRHTTHAPAQKQPSAETGEPQGSATILLVDDEQTLLNITSRLLESLGYTVLKAHSPNEAIDIAEEQKGNIDLLMTDVVMPEMNGQDLAKILQHTHPELKRLFMSGYTAEIISDKGIIKQGLQFLQKPFTRKKLADTIHLVLNSETQPKSGA